MSNFSKLSYAQALAAAPSVTPDLRLSALRWAYSEGAMLPSEVLKDALGAYLQPHPQVPGIARKLVKHTIILCVDTESHTMNTDQMTELGIAQISYGQSSYLYRQGVGPHGQRLHNSLGFMHFRIAEHAHLKANRKDSRGAGGNRFGHTRWVTFQELRTILDHLFHRPIQSNDPELVGCLAPIVLVGHALKHDVENTLKPGLDFDITAPKTVVAKIDTQALAREGANPVWRPPPESAANEIGLSTLIDKLGFKHTDNHTACNDAARTMMCAIIMVLEDKFKKHQTVTMQEVADEVESRSQARPATFYGTQLCCTRCGGRDHSIGTCNATDIICKACDRFDTGPNSSHSKYSHIETYCQHVATFKGWLRRFQDANRKHGNQTRKFPPAVRKGPGNDAHPWSTWPVDVKWPLPELKDALEGVRMMKGGKQYLEPPSSIANLESALGGYPVPSTGNFVLLGTLSSAAATAHSRSTSTTTHSRSASTTQIQTSDAASSATSNSPSSAAGTREVTMSDRRAHGEGRGGAQAGARGALRGGPPRNGARGGSSTQDSHPRVSSWDPDNVWK